MSRRTWLAGSRAVRPPAHATTAYIDELLADQDENGSWPGGLMGTSEALLALSELVAGDPDDRVSAAVARAVDWLKGLRGGPGRFGDGCTPDRHESGLCHHFLGGFFAPEPPLASDEDLVWSGIRVPAGEPARLAASCVALRSCMRWGDRGQDARLHVDALRRLLQLDPRGALGLVSVDALPSVVLALLESPEMPGLRESAGRAIERITQSQRADGSWPELDAFPIMEVLLAAAAAGFDSETVGAAIRRGAGLLAVTQQEDGLWERETPPRRILVGWRLLRHAVLRDREANHTGEGSD